MKEHEQFADSLALYAVNALDDQREIAELQSHLGSCGECRRELEALRADTALLALSATGPQPPQRARQRLMQAIAAEPRQEKHSRSHFVVGRLRPRWMTWAPVFVAIVLAVISIGLMLDNSQLRRKNDNLVQQFAQEQHDAALAHEVMAMLNDPAAVRMTLVAAKTPPQPQVKTIYEPQKGHVLLLANNLSPLPQNKVYELWLIPMSGAPMPAGTFEPDKKGNTLMMHAMDSSGIQAQAFAVTVEPRGGSQTPTMPIVMMPAS
ncbi:MAG TPA: anti-sigma factor [Terriglobales bacterium]|nr:anti-sigma factor [Terriglobales bacterium]